MPAESNSTIAISEQNVGDEQILGQYIPLLYHYNMLQDEDRVGGFKEAIEFLVRPGDHVVELGGGTGILSSFAARCGARVTCVERNPELVAAARRFVKLNKLEDRITVIEQDAAEFVPATPVDFVVCEMLHVGLLREKQAQVISRFKQNYTEAHGEKLPTFMPEVSILMAQPVEHSFEFAGYVAPVPMFQAPVLDQPRTQELASLTPYAHIAYEDQIPMRFESCLEFVAECEGVVNAIRFVTQNILTVDEPGQRAITWPNQCLVLPLPQSFSVRVGDPIEVGFCYRPGDTIERLMPTLEARRLQTHPVAYNKAA